MSYTNLLIIGNTSEVTVSIRKELHQLLPQVMIWDCIWSNLAFIDKEPVYDVVVLVRSAALDDAALVYCKSMLTSRHDIKLSPNVNIIIASIKPEHDYDEDTLRRLPKPCTKHRFISP